jgi:hypothetical protein
LRSERGTGGKSCASKDMIRGSLKALCPSSNKPRPAQPEAFCSLIGAQLSTAPTRNDIFFGRRRRIFNGQAFRMFSHVDPIPGVVVQGRLRGWRRKSRRTRARTRSHLASMSISIAAKVRARSAGDRCRPRPTTRLHRRNCEDPGGAAGRPGLCIHRSPFGREHGAEQTECDGPRSARGRTRRTAQS